MDRTFSVSAGEELPTDESFTKVGNDAFEIIGEMNSSDENPADLHILGESTMMGDSTLTKSNTLNNSDDATVVIAKLGFDEIVMAELDISSTDPPSSDVPDDITHTKPNLNGTFTVEKDEQQQQQVTPEHEHERHHVRHHTVTLEAGGINKEVADFMKELVDSHPDNFMDILQTKMVEFALAKEAEWKNNYAASLRKVNAVYEMKLASTTAMIEQENENKQNGGFTQVDPKLNAELTMAMKDRDQFRDQAISTMRTANERAKEQEYFMEKAKRYASEFKRMNEEARHSKEVETEINNRYNALLQEAEQQLAEVEGAIAHYKQQNDQDSVGLRLRVRQQEMRIKSLQALIDSLNQEKMELITMCEELVQQFDKSKVQNNVNAESCEI